MKLFTPDMNDRELDDLFREAATKGAAPARREEVWAKLEEKLTTPGQPRRRRWVFLLIPVLILVGLLTWQLYPGGSKGDLQVAGSGNATAPKNSGFPSERYQRSDGRAANAPVRERVTLPPAVKPLDSAASAVKHSVVFNTPGYGIAKDGAPPATTLPKDHASSQDIASLPLWSKLPMDIRKGALAPSAGTSISAFGSWDFDNQPLRHSLATLATPGSQGEFKKETVPAARDPRTSKGMIHWTIGITAGPDWSSVAAKGWGTGVGAGLKLGYRLNDKWALSTGVLLDKKIYEANPGDYNPLDNNWRNYDVQHINANCAVIDVPIDIAYTVWSNQQHRILLSTGLSSFWMHKEEYTYHYKTTGGEWAQWSKEMYGKNHYLLSVLNLSAGYEKSWKNMSFEVTPYVKVPLGGIGYGRVKLLSTGVHFTLKYGLK